MRRGGSATPMLVAVENRSGLAVLRIQAPPLNLLTQALRRAIRAAAEAAQADEAVRAVVFAGCATNFCAGADLKEFPARSDAAIADEHCRNGHAMTCALVRCDKPVIAAIEGACLGGGLELALCCDVRIAATDARLGLPEINRGVFPGTGGIFLLRHLIGPSRAKSLVFSGIIFEASSPLADGIVDQRVEPGTALAAALALAESLAERPALSLRTAKRLVDHELRTRLESYLETERKDYVACFQGNDSKEGWRSFLEKRPPSWTHS